MKEMFCIYYDNGQYQSEHIAEDSQIAAHQTSQMNIYSIYDKTLLLG